MGYKFTHLVGYGKSQVDAFDSFRSCFIYHYGEESWQETHNKNWSLQRRIPHAFYLRKTLDQGSRKFLSLTLATSSKQMVQMLRRRIGTIIIVVRIFLRFS